MPNATLVGRLVAGLLALLPVSLQAQQLDPTFHPPHFVAPNGYGASSVEKVLRQADGRYLVRGSFQSVDGHTTAWLARLLSTGHVDTTFTYRPAPLVHSWNALRLVAAQPDGKVVVNRETTTGESTMLRLLPSGRPDSTFRVVLPALLQGAGTAEAYQLLAQPDGKLLLGGGIADSAGYWVQSWLIRLQSNGQVDASFTPPTLPIQGLNDLLLEPDGRIVYVSSSFSYGSPGAQMGRLLASGRPDSSFTYSQQPNVHIGMLARCPDGSYAVGGALGAPSVRYATGRLLTTGAWDTSYPFSLGGSGFFVPMGIPVYIQAIAVQADGRILAGGYMSSEIASSNDRAALVRAQLHGGLDTSFNANFIYFNFATSYPPYNSNVALVKNMLVEPSGKVLVAGTFDQAGGVAHWGLARLMPAAPLATTARNTASFDVWPVPAHGELHVQLPTAQAAQQVELLDATGRRVLTQPARTAALTLNTAALPTGLYVVRVRYSDGTAATRRVVLE